MPTDTDLVHGFANTLDQRGFRAHGVRHTGADAFADVAGLAGWLRGHGLLDPGEDVGEADRAAAVEFRAALRAALAREADLPALPGLLAVRSGPAGPELVPTGTGVTRALGAVLAAAVRLAATDRWRRLKTCPDPDCRWVFVDRSRPGRARWCATERCGNRAKTRAYRERTRASTPVEPG